MAGKSSRLCGGTLCLAASLAVLFLATSMADGSFTRRINQIYQNLNRALLEMLQLEHTNYTELTANATYLSSTAYDPRGMGGLYNLTKAFVDLLVDRDVYPDGLIEVDDGEMEVNVDMLPSVVKQYAGLLVVVIILLLFGTLMPICGLCFCCCRCCGKCGARSRPFDKKHDLCKKILLATILIALGTLMLFGVVCAFVSNQQVQDGTEQLPNNLRTSVGDASLYLKTTQGQINTLFRTNYQEFENTTFVILNRAGEIVYDQLVEYSNAVSMTNIVQLVQSMEGVSANLTILKKYTRELRVNASQLNDALRKVKRDLLHTLNNCRNEVPKCGELSKNYINDLGSDIDFNSLPDISTEIDQLDNILGQDIIEMVNKGHENLLAIRNRIQEVVDNQLINIKNSVAEAGLHIKNGSDSVSNVITNVTNLMQEHSDKYLLKADEYINKYSPYRYYVSIGVSCVLLFLAFCIVFGLICGVCGKRPDAYGDDCCNKGSGSKFLMCGVLVMFLASIVLAVITLVYFLTGVMTQRIVCDTLRNPHDSKLLNLADEVLEIPDVKVNISTILKNCHRNYSIYNVLQLKNIYDVTEVNNYLKQFNIEEALNKLEVEIKENVPTNISILNSTAKEQLDKLANSSIGDINYDRFTHVLENNFTNHDLTEISDELAKLITIIEENKPVGIEEVISDLQLSLLHLRTYQSKLVDPMVAAAKRMISVAKSLEDMLQVNSSFSDTIRNLIQEVQNAEEVLLKEGPEVLKDIAGKFAESVVVHVETYLDRVVTKTVDHIGECGPMSLVFNATLVATCEKIILPWNGFWFGVFWSLILFIPTIIVSVKLATLYQKYNPYGGHLIEAEYLYDAYADHDNIPLNSRGKPKKKKKVIKREERNAVPGPTGDHEVPRDYVSGSHGQETRYADMAPKHWEEYPPNGPPQYQRAPTEYERPPPYYYPANSDQQQR